MSWLQKAKRILERQEDEREAEFKAYLEQGEKEKQYLDEVGAWFDRQIPPLIDRWRDQLQIPEMLAELRDEIFTNCTVGKETLEIPPVSQKLKNQLCFTLVDNAWAHSEGLGLWDSLMKYDFERATVKAELSSILNSLYLTQSLAGTKSESYTYEEWDVKSIRSREVSYHVFSVMIGIDWGRFVFDGQEPVAFRKTMLSSPRELRGSVKNRV